MTTTAKPSRTIYVRNSPDAVAFRRKNPEAYALAAEIASKMDLTTGKARLERHPLTSRERLRAALHVLEKHEYITVTTDSGGNRWARLVGDKLFDASGKERA